MTVGIKLQQAKFLLKYIIFCPLNTFLWYIDELLYPSYKHLKIQPIFITGEGRSGTTFLHRTLASDGETFFAIRHFEWRYPFISIQKLIKYFGLEERIKKINYWSNTEAGLMASKMHPNTLYDWEEDGVLFEECFLTHFFILFQFPYLQLLTVLDDFEKLPSQHRDHMMKVHQKVVKKIMYCQGKDKIFLSKDALSYKSKLGTILKTYPNAKFIVILRKSNEFMSSMLKLMHLSTSNKTDIDIFSIDGFKPAFMQRMVNDSSILVSFLKSDIAQPRICILYSQFVLDVKGTILDLYQKLDLQVPNNYEFYLDETNKKQKHRKREYEYKIENFPEFEEFDKFIDSIKNTYKINSKIVKIN